MYIACHGQALFYTLGMEGWGKKIFVFMEQTFHWKNVRVGTINKII